MTYKILVINPGSTSTKIAIFDNNELIFEKTLRHSYEEIKKYKNIYEQFEFRKQVILNTLLNIDVDIKSLDAVVGRGGAIRPIPSGTYIVCEKMLEDCKKGVQAQHASNLGAILADAIAEEANIEAFIVDPIVVDEMQEVARITGLPEIKRRCIFHPLNQKAVAREAAKHFGKKYEDVNVIVVHLGGGISVGIHEKGKIIDVNNATDGDGPFSPERAGELPALDIIDMCFSGKYTKDEMKKKIMGQGGLIAYFGTNDVRKICMMAEEGDKKADLIYNAMAYNIAKEIGSSSAVLKGNVDIIVITGGIAYDDKFIKLISDRVSFISPIKVYPGEKEMEALAVGALRVLNGEEKAKNY